MADVKETEQAIYTQAMSDIARMEMENFIEVISDRSKLITSGDGGAAAALTAGIAYPTAIQVCAFSMFVLVDMIGEQEGIPQKERERACDIAEAKLQAYIKEARKRAKSDD